MDFPLPDRTRTTSSGRPLAPPNMSTRAFALILHLQPHLEAAFSDSTNLNEVHSEARVHWYYAQKKCNGLDVFPKVYRSPLVAE
jgi:hypothetical protein